MEDKADLPAEKERFMELEDAVQDAASRFRYDERNGVYKCKTSMSEQRKVVRTALSHGFVLVDASQDDRVGGAGTRYLTFLPLEGVRIADSFK